MDRQEYIQKLQIEMDKKRMESLLAAAKRENQGLVLGFGIVIITEQMNNLFMQQVFRK